MLAAFQKFQYCLKVSVSDNLQASWNRSKSLAAANTMDESKYMPTNNPTEAHRTDNTNGH
jgi:hypothetical protein